MQLRASQSTCWLMQSNIFLTLLFLCSFGTSVCHVNFKRLTTWHKLALGKKKKSFFGPWLAATTCDVTNHTHTLHISHWDSRGSTEKALQQRQKKPSSGNCGMNINIYIVRYPKEVALPRTPFRVEGFFQYLLGFWLANQQFNALSCHCDRYMDIQWVWRQFPCVLSKSRHRRPVVDTTYSAYRTSVKCHPPLSLTYNPPDSLCSTQSAPGWTECVFLWMM